MIWGANDQVLSDVPGAIRAADQILKVRQVVIPKCGHAPQIEKARLVNQLVVRYLNDKLKTIPPRSTPSGSWRGRGSRRSSRGFVRRPVAADPLSRVAGGPTRPFRRRDR